MPVKVRHYANKYRVVEPDGKIVKHRSGKAVDGGGHSSRDKAQRQANAINANTKEK